MCPLPCPAMAPPLHVLTSPPPPLPALLCADDGPHLSPAPPILPPLQVIDPVKASYGVDNAIFAVGQIAQTTMVS